VGRVLDESRAMTEECKCFVFEQPPIPKNMICFQKGILGALTNEQDVKYCTKKKLLEPSEKWKRRRKLLKEVLGIEKLK
jgi:hypothetical protein